MVLGVEHGGDEHLATPATGRSGLRSWEAWSTASTVVPSAAYTVEPPRAASLPSGGSGMASAVAVLMD